MSYLFNALKEKATSHIQQLTEKMMIPVTPQTQEETEEREEVLDIIVDDDDWGANSTSPNVKQESTGDFLTSFLPSSFLQAKKTLSIEEEATEFEQRIKFYQDMLRETETKCQ
jgi:hypothetical protein